MAQVKFTKRDDDDSIIDLRKKGGAKKVEPNKAHVIMEEEEDNSPEFKISHVEESPQEENKTYVSPVSDDEISELKASDNVKVKFDKFVNLVVSKADAEMMEKYMDEDIIVGTNLLTELASVQKEDKEGKKVPIMFILGILIGIGLAYILLKM